MQGRIIKGIAGFYYVYVIKSGIYECKARGIFRSQKIKPLVGDKVKISVLSEEEKLGNIDEIFPRTSELIRPAVANVDQALVIFAGAKPEPSLNLLDRFLLMMEKQNIPILLCFNKNDISDSDRMQELVELYGHCGYRVLLISAYNKEGIDVLKSHLKGKTTAAAGPSGVGKSSVINLLQTEVYMETGSISTKIERGKHTTRHSELLPIDDDSFILDTPGFASIYLPEIEKEKLQYYFPEFRPFVDACRFQGCVHIKEPNCALKAAVESGEVAQSRYDNYVTFYNELKEKEKRRYS